MIGDILRTVLAKAGVSNLEELVKKVTRGFKYSKTPAKDVKIANETGELSPHLNTWNELLQDIHRLSQDIDYEYYDEENQIYQTGTGYGYIFEATPILGVQENTSEVLFTIFNTGLPENTCVQFLLQASGEVDHIFTNWKGNVSDKFFQKIAEERINFLKQGTKGRLFKQNKISVRDFKLFISISFEGIFSDDAKPMIENTRISIKSILESQGIYTQNLKPQGLINLVRQIVCPKQDGIDYLEYDEQKLLRTQISTPDDELFIGRDGMVSNDVEIKCVGVNKFNPQAYLHQINNLIGDQFSTMLQIPYPFITFLNFKTLGQEKTNAKLRLEAERVQKQAREGYGRFNRDIPKKAEEFELMKDVIAEGEGLVLAAMYTILYTPLEKSEEAFQEAQALYRSNGFELVNYSNVQYPLLLSSLPLFFNAARTRQFLQFDFIGLHRQFNIVNWLPIFSDWKGTGSPTIMTIGRRGQIQFIDLFDNDKGNYNFSVVATSGSGKSFFMNELIRSYLQQGALARIIDIGGSYKNLCEILGGQYIEFGDYGYRLSYMNQEPNINNFPDNIEGVIYSNTVYYKNVKDDDEIYKLDVADAIFTSCSDIVEGKYKLNLDKLKVHFDNVVDSSLISLGFIKCPKICVNPFSYIADSAGNDLVGRSTDELKDGGNFEEQVQMLKSIIMLAAGRKADKTEDSFVEQAIIKAISEYGRRATFTTVYDNLMAISDGDKKRPQDIATSLSSYTKHGVFGRYFEGDSTLNFNNQFIVLELESLNQKGELLNIIMLIVMLKIGQEVYMGNRALRKICAIDEAYQTMSGSEHSAKFIEIAYRRFRKYGGAIGTITQSIDDYFKTETTMACWNNADIKFLLRQGTKSKNQQFDPYTQKLLDSVTTESGVYSEMLVMIGGQTCGVSRLIVDPFSAFIYSSKAEEVAFIKYIKQYESLDIVASIERMLELTKIFAELYRVSYRNASEYLVPDIRDFGYENVVNRLILLNVINNEVKSVNIARDLQDKLINYYAHEEGLDKMEACKQLIQLIKQSGISDIKKKMEKLL